MEHILRISAHAVKRVYTDAGERKIFTAECRHFHKCRRTLFTRSTDRLQILASELCVMPSGNEEPYIENVYFVFPDHVVFVVCFLVVRKRKV